MDTRRRSERDDARLDTASAEEEMKTECKTV
jgi:hypothetical protein